MAENFASLLDSAARRTPDKVALVWDGGSLAWGELDRRAGGFARSLAERGVRAGDRIALLMGNRWPLIVALWGGLKLGATVVPLNPLLAEDERSRVVAHLRPTLVVDAVGDEEAEWASVPSTDSPALILYTSGSTGQPKGAVLSHAALTFSTRSWADAVMALGPEDRVLAVLPFSHSYGLNGALFAPLSAGATVVLLERFSPEDVLAAIVRQRVTVFPGVATMFRRLLDSPQLESADLSSLRLALSGAAPCPWDLAEEWRARTSVRILRGYGMTELFRPISYLAGDVTDLPDAIGRAVPGVSVRAMDDDGRPVPAGDVGELWIKSPAALDGYLDDPAETRAVLEDGWFKTGDLVHISPDGYVRIAGRKRELILRGGYSVFPAEVEAALLTHPAVAEAAAVGVAHAELGEDVVAFVTLHVGRTATPAQLIAHGKERLAAYKYPRRIVIVDQLPKGPTGKILKSRLTTPGTGETS
ncbi:MAG TPA: AMP-binding protein [Candidatus Methylomirabilis sp.]|nr:AMP-binding protein [Candidatus Methylomirabilis sp.]